MPAASPPRRLNLVDGMILVAGVAVAFALTRERSRSYVPMPAPPWNSSITPFWGRSIEGSAACSRVAMIWLAVLSPTMLLIRRRRPRPRGSRLWRQPGAVACLAATATVVIELVCWIAAATAERRGFTEFFAALTYSWRLPPAGAAVAGAWLGLLLTRRWRPERGTIDRGGRLIGVGWMLAFVILVATTSWEQIRAHIAHLAFRASMATMSQQVAMEEVDMLKAEEDMNRAYAEEKRKFFDGGKAWADHLSRLPSLDQVHAALDEWRRTIEQNRAEFEAAEAARIQAKPNPTVVPAPPPGG